MNTPLSNIDATDIHNSAAHIADGVSHLRHVLSALAESAPHPLSHHLKSCALACEALHDRAMLIKDTVQ